MTSELTESASGLWLTFSELARRKNVSRQAIAKRVLQFEAAGLLETRAGQGRTKLVNVAAFDHAAEEQTDITRDHSERTVRQDGRRAAYNEAMADKARYEAELRRLDLAERLKLVVPVDELENVTMQIGGEIVTALERLPNEADALVTAAMRGGVGQMRTVLRKIVYDQRKQISVALAKLAQAERADPPRTLDSLDISTTEAAPELSLIEGGDHDCQ